MSLTAAALTHTQARQRRTIAADARAYFASDHRRIAQTALGLIVWPTARPGGLLGVRGARTAWCALWLIMAWLWLEEPSAGANAISSALQAAPSGMVWLSSLQIDLAHDIAGANVPIAIALGALSAAIAIAVAANRHTKPFLWLAILLNLAYWILGQGLGGIFQGGATDPDAGPLFILLAYTLYTLPPAPPPTTATIDTNSAGRLATDP